MNAKAAVLGAWGVVVVITTIQWISSSSKGFPPPGRYLASGVVFSILFLTAGPAPSLGAALAVGTAVGVGFHPYLKGQTGVFQQAGNLLGQVAGQPKTG